MPFKQHFSFKAYILLAKVMPSWQDSIFFFSFESVTNIGRQFFWQITKYTQLGHY